jgi:hypothetical protein
MTKKHWVDFGGNFSFGEIPDVHKALPSLVYELEFNAESKQFFLRKVSDTFGMPEKVYGLEDSLIERVLTTFNRLNKNFGVLLKGLKGTGKTIAAKVICNKINLPVILVTKPWPNIGNFINSIDQNIVLFFDEFEKVYEYSSYVSDDEFEEGSGKSPKQNVNSLLTLMDGVFTSKYKRLFLLTTNKDYLPDPMVARPSRIRYVKDFSDLNYEGIMEILNDTVINKKHIPELAKLLKGLEIITVDIVKSVAEESNIYDTADPDHFSIFNVKKQERKWDIYEIDDERKETLIYSDETAYPDQFRKGQGIYVDHGNEFIGNIEKIDHEKCQYVCVDKRTHDNVGEPRKITRRTILYKKATKGHASMIDYAYAM